MGNTFLGLSSHGLYSVLLFNVHVVFLQNPFILLHRDCDVESMTNGYDSNTTNLFNDSKVDESLGWSQTECPHRPDLGTELRFFF